MPGHGREKNDSGLGTEWPAEKPMQARTLIGAGAMLAVLSAAPVRAEETDGRYTMSPTEGGFIRLDRKTGAMAFCSGKDSEWSCKPMPDSEQQLTDRIEQLERENKALREDQEARAGAPGESAPDAAPGQPEPLPIPKEEDVDKLFDYVEGMMRKFKERIKRLEEEAKRKEGEGEL